MKKTILISIVILFVWAIFVEPNLLIVKKYNVEDKELRGIKVVLIGDFHLKTHQEKRLKRIVKLVNKQNPDLILSVGDFVNGHEIKRTLPIEVIAKNMGDLKSNYGVYTVLGNHDWWIDGNKITKELENNGINVLANSDSKININGRIIHIGGVEDLYTRIPDIIKATPKNHKPTILLTHSPDLFPNVSNNINLTLAGHTHGGQVRLPFIGGLIVPSKYGNRYSQGLITEDGKKMIVTKGIGTSILPIRFNCIPEIVVIDFL